MHNVHLVGIASLFKFGMRRILEDAGFSVDCDDPPDLAVMCIGQGLEAVLAHITKLKLRSPEVRVVLIGNAASWPIGDIMQCLEAGADAYFVDPSETTFLHTVQLVLDGMRVLPRQFAPPTGHVPRLALLPPANTPRAHGPSTGHTGPIPLSSREHTILLLLTDGMGNKQIGRKLGITEATVKVHVKAILRKLGLRNRAQAAVYGVRLMVNGAAPLSSFRMPEPPEPIILDQEPV